MKKGIKITAIVVASIIVLAVVLPFAFRDKIDAIIKREASAMLNAKLSFDKLSISLIRHFPNASLDLNGFSLVGVDKFEADTLVAANKISVVVNLMSIFSDSFTVNKVLLDKPSVLAIQLKTGEVNWDIMKPSQEVDSAAPDSTQSAFKLSMKDVRINGGGVTYLDSLSGMSFYTDKLNLRMRGDLSAAQSDIKLKLDSKNIYYTMGKMAMLSGAQTEINMDIAADLENNKYTLKDNKIKLNAIEVALDGWVAMREKAIDMDLKLLSSKVQFRDLLSMIPAFYTKDFKDLSAKGELSLSAWAKGELTEKRLPAFEVNIGVGNGSFKYAALPKAVENINIKASASNSGGGADNTILALDRLSLAIAGNTLNATIKATHPMSDIQFKGTANGVVNLGMVKEVYPLGDSISLSGVVTADVAVAGRMSDVENQRYESIEASGKFGIDNMTVQLTDLPSVQLSMDAAISPHVMTLSSLQAKIGRSDISASGSLTNYLGYVLRDDKLSGRLDVMSKLLDLNELMSSSDDSPADATDAAEKQADTASLSVFVVPENLHLALSAVVDKVEFAKMNIENFTGAITVAGGAVKMDRLSMNALGGKIGASGSYSTAANAQAPQLSMNLDVVNCSFSKTFAELDMVKKIVPLFEKTGGDYSMKMDMNTTLNSQMSPELMTLSAKGVIESSNIHIQNIKAFEALAAALKNDKFKNIQAKDLKISFSIDKGLIHTSPFDIKMGDVNLNMSGYTGLDQSIDYVAKVTLPKALTGGLMSNVNVKIGGTFSSPKVTLGVKEMAEDALKNAITQGVEKLTGGNATEEAIADGKDKLRAEADKLIAEAKVAGDKLIETARAEGDKLVAKANNPIVKIAAQKSADMLVKKAQEQAQKMISNAEQKAKELE